MIKYYYIFMIIITNIFYNNISHVNAQAKTKDKYSKPYAVLGTSDLVNMNLYGFDINGHADMQLKVKMTNPKTSSYNQMMQYNSLNNPTRNDRIMFYVNLCPYKSYRSATRYYSSIARSLPTESRSMCVLDWYHKNAPDCIAYPLIATPDTTKDLGGTYTANLQFNITFTKPEVYVFTFTNCEMRGYRGAALRSCPSTNLITYVETNNGNNGGDHISSFTYVNDWNKIHNINCTMYVQDFNNFDLEFWYTYKNPNGWLSTSEVPYITVYFVIMLVYAALAIVWIVNTFIFRNANGILLQWHIAPILVLKSFVQYLNWQYWVNSNLNKPTTPLVNVVVEVIFETLLYEMMIRIAKGWMITTKSFTRKETVQMYLVLFVFFLGKLFSTYFSGSQFIEPYYRRYSGTVNGLNTAIYVMGVISLGVSYAFILVVVWIASVNRSGEMSLQLEALEDIQPGVNLANTPQDIKLRLFLYYRWAFTMYLCLNAITWFYINIEVSVRVYSPYVKQIIDDTIEFIFLLMILIIFRARNFNIIIVTLNDVLMARFNINNSQVVPSNEEGTTSSNDDNNITSKQSIVFVNPDNNGSIGYFTTDNNNTTSNDIDDEENQGIQNNNEQMQQQQQDNDVVVEDVVDDNSSGAEHNQNEMKESEQ